MALTILSVLTGALVLFTVMPLLRAETWWVRVLDFPRLQLLGLGGLLLLADVLLLDWSGVPAWIVLAATLGCMACQGWWIWPYTVLHRKEVGKVDSVDPDNRLRIMVANVLISNQNSARLLEMVRSEWPDLLVTSETNAWWDEALSVLERDYPYVLKCPLENAYGMHLYSRLPLEDAQIRFLVEPERPSMHALVRLPSNRRICLHCLHPSPPSPSENAASRQRDGELIMVAKQVVKARMPVVVTGDLNDVGWSATTRLFRKISALLDPRIGRGMFNTYHAGHWWLRWPLDHLFHSSHFGLSRLKRLGHFGSDHFPIVIELVLDPAHASEQHGLHADQQDRAWADDKLGEVGASPSEVPVPGR